MGRACSSSVRGDTKAGRAGSWGVEAPVMVPEVRA
jgi:hypothetical protein